MSKRISKTKRIFFKKVAIPEGVILDGEIRDDRKSGRSQSRRGVSFPMAVEASVGAASASVGAVSASVF